MVKSKTPYSLPRSVPAVVWSTVRHLTPWRDMLHRLPAAIWFRVRHFTPWRDLLQRLPAVVWLRVKHTTDSVARPAT